MKTLTQFHHTMCNVIRINGPFRTQRMESYEGTKLHATCMMQVITMHINATHPTYAHPIYAHKRDPSAMLEHRNLTNKAQSKRNTHMASKVSPGHRFDGYRP